MEFFAGANTRFGFVSIFEDIFKSIERLYILKGSSGCGKSTLIRRIARTADEMGIGYHLIRCSADPKSLDGIIVPDLRFGVADGTAPHLLDVKYPCVRETIINLGQFWNEAELLPYRAEIIGLTDLKGCHYKNAYRALSAAGSVDSLYEEILGDCIDVKRLDSFAFRFSNKVFSVHGGHKKVFSSAFTSEGQQVAEICKSAKTIYTVNGRAERVFMSALSRIVAEVGYEAVIGCNWSDGKYTDLIYIPESQTVITSLDELPCQSYEKKRITSTSRFIHGGKFNAVKTRLHGLERLKKELLEQAREELAFAKEVHDELEEIYIPAMDFEAMDRFAQGFINKLFGE